MMGFPESCLEQARFERGMRVQIHYGKWRLCSEGWGGVSHVIAAPWPPSSAKRRGRAIGKWTVAESVNPFRCGPHPFYLRH